MTIDVPFRPARVARVHTDAERVTAVDFVNVPSYVLATDIETETSRGRVRVDIGYRRRHLRPLAGPPMWAWPSSRAM